MHGRIRPSLKPYRLIPVSYLVTLHMRIFIMLYMMRVWSVGPVQGDDSFAK